MIGKLPMLLSVELLVLIAALFLLVYITKSQVSKWFTYGTVLIIIFTLCLMICSVCGAVMMHHGGHGGMGGECRMEEQCGPGGMMMHQGGMMKRIVIKNGECEDEMMENCGMKGGDMKCCKEGEGMDCCKKHGGMKCDMEGGDMNCCKKGMNEGKCMDKDSMQKKEIIIKKK